jgi:putative transposase
MRRTSSYPSDLTDGQWQVIAPHLPADQPGRRGRPRIWPLRVIVEAILYLDRTGCPWRYLPDSFPPWPTVYGYFAAWRDDGTLAAVHDALRAQVRAAAGRDTEPTAAIIDSQSVRAADTVPRASRGWDNAKKVNGRKRHIAVDAMGLLLAVVITAASVQDRDAARPLLWNLHRASRHIRLIWADAVYTGKLSAWAASMKMTLCIVARRQPHTFEVLPRRWVVERTFAWISKHRRTVRDYETLPASHEAMILWAMIALMTRRLTQPAELSDTHLVFGADELIEPRHRLAPRHRDRIAPGVTPGHPEPIQRLAAQPENIRGLVREQISRILVPVVAIRKLCPHPVNSAITIRVEQPAGKSACIFRDNDALPWLQLDFPHVLAPRSLLREEARPMPRTTDHFGAAGLLLGTDLVARPHCDHGPLALAPEPRPGVRARNAELPDVLVPRAGPAYAAISQVQSEQVRVVGLRFGRRRARRAPRADGAGVDANRMLAPVMQRRP